VLVIDELGYLPLDQTSANWIFQIVSRRYERDRSCSPTPRFRRLGPVFADQVVAGANRRPAPAQRHVLNVRGHSYRTRHYVDAQGKGGDAGTFADVVWVAIFVIRTGDAVQGSLQRLIQGKRAWKYPRTARPGVASGVCPERLVDLRGGRGGRSPYHPQALVPPSWRR